MNPQDPLANLRDIHLPAPVPAWPPAPGWWLLGAVLLAVLLAMALWTWRRWRRRRYRRAAITALRASYARYQHDGDGGHYLREANLILKQAALAAFPRGRVAALHGADWPAFLIATGGEPALQDAAGWLAAAYRPPEPTTTPASSPSPIAALSDAAQLQQLHRLLERWLRRHRC